MSCIQIGQMTVFWNMKNSSCLERLPLPRGCNCYPLGLVHGKTIYGREQQLHCDCATSYPHINVLFLVPTTFGHTKGCGSPTRQQTVGSFNTPSRSLGDLYSSLNDSQIVTISTEGTV